MAYARTTTVDAGAAGDTVKQAILDCDTDITGIFADLNTHEALTATHGATGAVVGTTNTQTLTGKTLSAPTISGVATLSSASLSGTLTLSNATLSAGTYTNSMFVTTVSPSTTDKALTASDMGKVWTNTGAEATIVYTLPEASTVIGRDILFVITASQTMTINPYDATDQILGITNSAGDSIGNQYIGDSITLSAIGDDSWAVTAKQQKLEGSWKDTN
jgi:hypothetical protein